MNCYARDDINKKPSKITNNQYILNGGPQKDFTWDMLTWSFG